MKKSTVFAICLTVGAGVAFVVLLHAAPNLKSFPQRAAAALAAPRTLQNPNSNAAPLALPLRAPRIEISKSTRRLTLYSQDKLVRTYTVGLGFAPEGDKERQGDGRTPEGEFYVCTKNDKSRYYLSLGLSYPNKAAAQRGLRDRLITRREHDQIISAIDRRARPPWGTALGGEIMIHGNGATRDWTLGCIALEDAEMRELFDHIPLGTPVRIVR